jgi:shikimate dehydrogenase
MLEPDRYAVFGHPISHSQSPRIHALFAEQTGQAISYTAQDVPPQTFDTAVRSFFASGGKGLNCTVPLKTLAFGIASTHSERARRAEAVNTLALGTEGEIYGDNTDGVGLVRDLLENHHIPITARRILILGAGGAVRGILAPLLELTPARLTIANRTAATAAELAEAFSDLAPIEGGGMDTLQDRNFDLILNATAASLSGQLPELPAGLLAAGGHCYDLAYGRAPTPFVRWGEQAGAALSVDGVGMLVEQAAEAFALWRGIRPATAPVIRLLNQARGLCDNG